MRNDREQLAWHAPRTVNSVLVALLVCLTQSFAHPPGLAAGEKEARTSANADPSIQAPPLVKEDVLSTRNGQFFLDGKPFAEISFNKFDLFWQLYDQLAAGQPLEPSNPVVKAQERALRNLHELGFRTIRIFALDNKGYMAISKRLRKPLMIGELGLQPAPRTAKEIWSAIPDYFESFDDQAAAKPWLMKALNDAVEAGVPLAYWWCYQADRPDDQNNRQRLDIDRDRNPELVKCIVEANKRLHKALSIRAQTNAPQSNLGPFNAPRSAENHL